MMPLRSGGPNTPPAKRRRIKWAAAVAPPMDPCQRTVPTVASCPSLACRAGMSCAAGLTGDRHRWGTPLPCATGQVPPARSSGRAPIGPATTPIKLTTTGTAKPPSRPDRCRTNAEMRSSPCCSLSPPLPTSLCACAHRGAPVLAHNTPSDAVGPDMHPRSGADGSPEQGYDERLIVDAHAEITKQVPSCTAPCPSNPGHRMWHRFAPSRQNPLKLHVDH